MIDLDLGSARHARVWFEGLQQAHFVPAGAVRQSVPVVSEAVFGERTCVSVELVVPHGARVDYGLLGACFLPLERQDDVTLIVDYVEGFAAGYEFDSSIAVAPERPVVGLPKELADSVATGASSQLAANWSGGPGELHFSYAAHGAYGSGRRVFSLLAGLVVILLQRPSSEARDVEGLFAATLST